MYLVNRSKTDLPALQKELVHAIEKIRALNLPKLGPAFGSLHGTPLHESLVSHRAISKFEIPNSKSSASRRKASIEKMVAQDEALDNLLASHVPIDLGHKNIWGEHNLMKFTKAKLFLARALDKFKPSYNAVFPSGETYVSSKGQTGLMYKLGDPIQWTVSIDCVDYAANICYHNIQLKRLVKKRFNDTCVNARQKSRVWYTESSGNPGFYCFKRMFAYCCDIVGVSRLTTVPKNNDSDRTITCEPFWNMVSQLSFARDLRGYMFRNLGIHLESLQELHKSLLATGKATIDFSAASDTNLWCVVKQLFPSNVVKYLARLRTGIVEYNDGDETSYVPLNMFAPMGTGCTFEVMTLTLLSYARSFDSGATVFGDDVIISCDSAKGFIAFVSSLGWKVNATKSFITGNFRESCGGFYDLKSRKALQSYDFWYPEDLPSMMVILGKVRALLKALPKCRVRTILLSFYCVAHRHVSRDCLEPDWTSSFDVFSLEGFPTPMWRERATDRNVLAKTWSSMWQRNVSFRRFVTYAPLAGKPKGMQRREVSNCVLFRTMQKPTWQMRGNVLKTFTGESHTKTRSYEMVFVSPLP